MPPADSFRGAGKYRIDAYSEFLPPPRVGWKPYGSSAPDPELFSVDDPHGWWVGEFEEALELKAGLQQVGKQVIRRSGHLLAGDRSLLPNSDLHDNPFWVPELCERSQLEHERCDTLSPLALSRTQDDKGRVRWSLFGISEQGPGRAFWKSFFTGPRQEQPANEAIDFFCRLLNEVYGERLHDAAELNRSGFRILPDREPLLPHWKETLPKWTSDFLLPDRAQAKSVRYLLTFRPFGKLPAAIRKAYLAGDLHLLPFPGSLVYWGVPGYRRLAGELPLAGQIPHSSMSRATA